jgi:hypothetical protein
METNIGLAEREILALVYTYHFKNPYIPRLPDNF